MKDIVDVYYVDTDAIVIKQSDLIKLKNFISNNSSLGKLKIKQINGSLGLLKDIEFGIKNDSTQIISNAYKNFHLLDINKQSLQWSEDFDQILFLGFAFNSTNVKILNLSQFHA